MASGKMWLVIAIILLQQTPLYTFDTESIWKFPAPKQVVRSIEKRSNHIYSAERQSRILDMCQQDILQPITDFILRVFRSQIVKAGKEEIKIPDIHKKKFEGAGPLGLEVHFDASSGWLRDLSSLHRVGNVNITRSGNDVIIELSAGLELLEFGYYKYDLTVGAISTSGHIGGRVANSSITIKFSMDVGGQTCGLSLLNVKVGLLGDLKMKATGMGLLNFLYSQIVTAVTNNYREQAVPKAERALRRNIEEMFEKLRCGGDY